MWNFTEKNKLEIKEIYEYFLPKFPEIDKKVLYDRIFRGYCWGEGGCPACTIEAWNKVFYKGKCLFTVFEDWDDYFQYDGDWHKKVEAT